MSTVLETSKSSGNALAMGEFINRAVVRSVCYRTGTMVHRVVMLWLNIE